MLYGALLPTRLGERFDCDNSLTYGAITHVYYFGDMAFATGLVDTPKPNHANELINELHKHGVKRFHYYSKGELVVWSLYVTEKGSVRAKRAL